MNSLDCLGAGTWEVVVLTKWKVLSPIIVHAVVLKPAGDVVLTQWEDLVPGNEKALALELVGDVVLIGRGNSVSRNGKALAWELVWDEALTKVRGLFLGKEMALVLEPFGD